MSYKTILVHVDRSSRADARVALAARLALDEQAYLIGAASSGFVPELYVANAMMMAAPMPLEELEVCRAGARRALDNFEKIARGAGVDAIERRLGDDPAQHGIVLQARYADLVVVGQHDPADPDAGATRDLPEYAALQGGRPVLVVPYAGRFDRIDRHALVAWDGSRSAVRALTDALPLLRRTGSVTLAVFNPQRQYGVHGDLPGADIALLLARHGVKVDVLRQDTPPGLDVGNALLSLAADIDADLLVMGAYGHMRWREVLMGGVTRTVLQSMTLPVLMSH
ncbi:MAG TPA: universal stress protein [Duganella sp.]|uniref:universal stress protein n=1 Tax=Duganella sp. TaxID=1904440 RepID=UPI002ECFC3E7